MSQQYQSAYTHLPHISGQSRSQTAFCRQRSNRLSFARRARMAISRIHRSSIQVENLSHTLGDALIARVGLERDRDTSNDHWTWIYRGALEFALRPLLIRAGDSLPLVVGTPTTRRTVMPSSSIHGHRAVHFVCVHARVLCLGCSREDRTK